ncbi:MAG: glycosyltransferase family 2 protein [Syntrophothermus sp.]
MLETIYVVDYMFITEIIFWVLAAVVVYTYIGYGLLLYLMVKIKRMGKNKTRTQISEDYEPEVTLFIAAYNEKDFVEEKMKNCLSLDYPADKLHILWITDGSDDGTPEMLRRYREVEVHHRDERSGKIGAMNRGMNYVTTPLVIFTDANTMISRDSIKRIVRLFNDPVVGCVSGEKRIFDREKDNAAGAGEGLYWKYESALKKWDAELNTVAGAAGELFAIRTHLFEQMEYDTLLDDFMISLRIAQKGYTIAYDPDAFAIEAPSASVKDEMKRKIRIAAGGIQSVVRMASLLNIFQYGMLSFQYISHRGLRWTAAPLSLLLLIPLNILLVVMESGFGIYTVILGIQAILYAAALLGWYLENKSIRSKMLFVPFYFFMMNLAIFLGFARYLKGSQSVNWDRVKRDTGIPVKEY